MPRNVADTVQKMLALSKDSGATQSEAENAAAMAHAMIMKYNLSEADYTSAQEKQQVNSEPIRQVHVELKQTWQQALMHYIAISTFCQTVRSGPIVYIFGQKHNILTVCHMFDYLVDRFTDIGKGQPTSFYVGAATAIHHRLKSQKEELTTTTTKALVITLDSDADQEMRRVFPNTIRSKPLQVRDYSSYNKGYSVGSTIGLDTQISS